MYQPQGIIHLTGEPDTGKTLAALGAYHPKNTAYFFDDVKRPPIAPSEFGIFIDIVNQYGTLKVLELYKVMMAQIDLLDNYDAIIFDTWARLGKAIRYYAKANPYEFREQSTFAPNGTIRNMEQWGETHNVEAMVISKLAQKCKALFLITHIKEKMIGGVKSGLYEPDAGKSFSKVCNMRLWLRHNENSGVPIALVLKRISKAHITDNGLEVVNVLPRRLTPADDHKSIWQVINHYWDNPIGNLPPQQGENPTPFELAILDGVLTDDMKEVWRAELRAKELADKEDAELFDSNWNEAKQLALTLSQDYNGMPPPMYVDSIIGKFNESYPDYDRNDLMEMLK